LSVCWQTGLPCQGTWTNRTRGGHISGQKFGARIQGEAEGAGFIQPREKKFLGGHLVALLSWGCREESTRLPLDAMGSMFNKGNSH